MEALYFLQRSIVKVSNDLIKIFFLFNLKSLNNDLFTIGHPDEKSFYFCGRSSLKDFSYCKLHLLYAYQPKGKKEEVTEKEEVPEFIEKKIQSA